MIAVVLTGCDMAATPLVPTAGPPQATPQLLGVTVEPLAGSSPEAAVPEAATAEPAPALVDETLPAWTVMVYSSADNDAWRYTWEAINQMEAAGASGQVQVVAAVDWPRGTDLVGSLPARYVIRGNNDPAVITSEEAVGADETNFGDPAVLADFIGWAVSTYPANRYALFLDGYGGGWRGCCLDTDPTTGDQTDFLSLDNLATALETSLKQSEPQQQLDVIAFSGSMMGQLDVYQAIRPYADYAVASAAPVPAGGWNYQTLLGALYANPWQDARELATLLTTDYVAYNRDLLGNEFVSMTAVDLFKLPDLATAVETLALALTNSPVGIGAAADARRGAQPYGAVLVDLGGQITAVDLNHAATLLAERADDVETAVSARAVSVAAQDATLAQAAGDGLPFATGMSIFWPASAGASGADYAGLGSLPNWAAWLESFAAQTEAFDPPFVDVTMVTEGAASQTSPVLLRAEVIGRQIDTIQIVTTRPEETTGMTVIKVETVPPPLVVDPDNGTGAYLWTDGRHATVAAWDAGTG
jgi:hypothetical protein